VFGGVILLKTFQRLGYFPRFGVLPPWLIHHLATGLGVLLPTRPSSTMSSGGSASSTFRRSAPTAISLLSARRAAGSHLGPDRGRSEQRHHRGCYQRGDFSSTTYLVADSAL
jgi:hypothetical protein